MFHAHFDIKHVSALVLQLMAQIKNRKETSRKDAKTLTALEAITKKHSLAGYKAFVCVCVLFLKVK